MKLEKSLKEKVAKANQIRIDQIRAEYTKLTLELGERELQWVEVLRAKARLTEQIEILNEEFSRLLKAQELGA